MVIKRDSNAAKCYRCYRIETLYFLIEKLIMFYYVLHLIIYIKIRKSKIKKMILIKPILFRNRTSLLSKHE